MTQTKGTSGPLDCIVIGAGFSGLAAAESLVDAGYTVKLLEARERVGGRARTETHGDVWLDYGGQWLGPGHSGMYEYARRYRKTVWPAYVKGRHTTWIQGQLKHHRIPFPTTLPWRALLNLTATALRFELLAWQVPLKEAAAAPKAKQWDAISLEQWMDQQLHHPQAYAVFKVAVEGVLAKHPADVTLLQALFYFRSNRGFIYATSSRGGAQQDRVDGGMQTLAEALANDLQQRGLSLELEAPVSKIEKLHELYQVSSAGAQYTARTVIVAAPPALTCEIDFQPALPQPAQKMLQALTPGCAIKCFAIYQRPFWRDQGFSGSVVSDEGPMHVCFDVTPPDCEQGILMGFIEGRDGVHWTDADERDRRETVLAQFATYFGPQAAEPLEYVDHSWLHDEWTRGCYVGTAGEVALSQWGQSLHQAHGQIVFAGTETATQFNGYFEGAVRAGKRAAGQVQGLLA